MRIGYARVSSDDQNLDLQRDALQKSGCERVYEEKESGGKTDRLVLLRMLEVLRKGDVVALSGSQDAVRDAALLLAKPREHAVSGSH